MFQKNDLCPDLFKYLIFKGFNFIVSHDCHFDIDRDISTAHCRSSSGDSVNVLSRTVCTTVVVSDWCITNLANGWWVSIHDNQSLPQRTAEGSVSSFHNTNNALDRNSPTMSKVCNTPITNNHCGTTQEKNNRFPFLDILGYLKNTHKNPKFGRVRQVPIRELGWEFPGWDLSHFAKFGIFSCANSPTQ